MKGNMRKGNIVPVGSLNHRIGGIGNSGKHEEIHRLYVNCVFYGPNKHLRIIEMGKIESWFRKSVRNNDTEIM